MSPLTAGDQAVRHFIYRHFVEHARAPSKVETADHFGFDEKEAERVYLRLHGGHFIFQNPGTTEIRMAHPFSCIATAFRVRANGEVSCLLDNIPSPNGLVMNKDETALYVAVTRGNCVWRIPFSRGGSAVKVGLYLQLSGGTGPDGIALDAEGRLIVAHVGLGAVWVFDRRGEPLYRIESCAGAFTTNVAFGTRDRNTLYITESESATILRAQLDIPGKTMFSHQ